MCSKLKRLLQDFDGVAVSTLSEIRTRHRDAPGFLENFIGLCADPNPNVSSGATWILKAEADDGVTFKSKQIDPLLTSLTEIPNWQGKLHVLQAVGAFELEKKQARILFDWATSIAEHERPFVRAWSINARVVIGMQFKDLLDEALIGLSVAENDPSASVRARSRNIRKGLGRFSQ